MNGEAQRRRLQDYFEGRLSPTEQAAVESWLASDERAGELLAELTPQWEQHTSGVTAMLQRAATGSRAGHSGQGQGQRCASAPGSALPQMTRAQRVRRLIMRHRFGIGFSTAAAVLLVVILQVAFQPVLAEEEIKKTAAALKEAGTLKFAITTSSDSSSRREEVWVAADGSYVQFDRSHPEIASGLDWPSRERWSCGYRSFGPKNGIMEYSQPYTQVKKVAETYLIDHRAMPRKEDYVETHQQPGKNGSNESVQSMRPSMVSYLQSIEGLCAFLDFVGSSGFKWEALPVEAIGTRQCNVHRTSGGSAAPFKLTFWLDQQTGELVKIREDSEMRLGGEVIMRTNEEALLVETHAKAPEGFFSYKHHALKDVPVTVEQSKGK